MLSTSPVSAKSIAFLLGLLYLQASSTEAAISTSARFPQDLFAKPAFQVNYGRIDKEASNLPVKRGDAIKILQQQEASSSSSSSTFSEFGSPPASDILSLAVTGHASSASGDQQSNVRLPLLWTLQRSSPEDFELCSIPDFTHSPINGHSAGHDATSFAGSSRSRQELIRHAQALLDPLKKVCLYHSTDWFTYSFCHGREIRQFRRLVPEIAAQKAFRAAGGGDAGKKAAMEAADKVRKVNYPIADPEYPAFILGRWTHQSEDIVGDDRSHQRRQQQPLSTDAANQPTDVATASDRAGSSAINSAGLDLVEEIQFGDWDEEELFAAETSALAQFEDAASDTAVETSREASHSAEPESHRHRYLTQRWTNGTMCDMNHQPRTVEVQYHCSNRKPFEDRIVMFKETTICNYVLIIETPRLCADSAFGSEQEEAPFQIHCHKVVRDDYAGPTAGDPDRILPPLSEIEGKTASRPSGADEAKSRSESSTAQKEAMPKSQQAEEATATSHTYGDPSRFGSVHDDYYDEALGGHGALYQQFHEHGHHQDHRHHEYDHGDEDEAEILVEIGLDDEGKLLVNKISDTAPEASKEVRRREGGKKRSDDDAADTDEPPMEIQLDMDDFMSVLRGEEGASLEKKLADKISDMLSKQMEQQYDSASSKNDDEGQGGKERNAQTPDDVAKLYKRLMSAVTGTEAGSKQPARKGSKQQSPPTPRMEKVGDSLSERVKRFYDAKKREEGEQEDETPSLAQHLEL